MRHYNAVIIGSGCAGLTSAIYLGRALLKPLVLSGVVWGGELSQTTDVENFPGFPESIQGPDLINNMKAQSEKFGATFIEENAVSVDTNTRPFVIKTHTGREMLTDSIIIASGSSTKWLGLENEEKLKGFGISSCVVCDAFFYKNKDVIVVGGGDSAFEGAIYLTKFCNKVTIVNRSDKYRASKILVERAKQGKVEFINDHSVKEWLYDTNGLTGTVLINTKTGVDIGIKIDGAFICIGHTPNTSFLGDEIELDKDGYIKTYDVSTRTSVEGIFAAGDCCCNEKNYKQAVTASGSGCKAALDCESFLENFKSI